MGVARHLGIDLDEYDARIRTFVPYYETLLEVTAGALGLVDRPAPVVVDLGVGTGALSEACLAVRPEARVVGIDTDPGMLEAARTRLAAHGSVELREGSFLDELPRADVAVACIALHHVGRADEKRALYRRAWAALEPGGLLASGDCYPAREARLAGRHREGWLAHLERTYTRSEAEGYLEAWSEEDTYFPLATELGWLEEAGFRPEVLWRRDGFAVVAGLRSA